MKSPSSGTSTVQDRPPFRERIGAFRQLPRILLLVWRTHRGFTIAIVALRIIRSAIPVSGMWVARLIIDEVVHLATTDHQFAARLWWLVGLELALVLAGEVLSRISALVEEVLGYLFTTRMSIRIMEHAATLDLQQFEDPELYNLLERARQGTTGRVAVLTQFLDIGQIALTLASLSIALSALAPLLLLLLVLAVVPSFVAETHFARLTYTLTSQWIPQRRQMDYVRLVAASDRTAKEVQLFGLAPWLIARYSILARRFVKVSTSLAFRRTLIGSGVSFVSAFAYYGAYVSVLSRALTGAISVGTLTFLAASFRQCRDGVQNLLSSVSSLYEQSLYLKDLWAFLDLRPAIGNAAHACPMPKKIQSGFVFEDVGFRYPGSDRWALRHIKFKLRCGERVALVGENGAGKTTLTKLIARLYDPTEGRILLDGVDLREYAITEVRRAIGVIFQDFVRYDMRFDENVGVGEVEPVRAYLDADETAQGLPLPIAISAAVDMALAASLPRRWPAGYRQMLGRRFEGGVELSGGEWQKVALARAYMRDAQVVILDEPTASLDARAEYEVFGRFNALMAGRTAIVISHRFSTVRVADRIVVLAGGRIVEEGPHETLVSANGVYADLFTLQAAAYK